MSVSSIHVDTDFSLQRLTNLFHCSQAGDVEWRHDIDFSPECAVRMARLEQSHGIQSTFYVMTRSQHYNPFAAETQSVLHEIVRCGHMIGLHVDLALPRTARVFTETMVDACMTDRSLLGRVAPICDAVSFHAPPTDALWREIPGFEHALSPEWKGHYISDSRGVWRESPEDKIGADDGPVQINCHPCWWFWPEEKADRVRALEAEKP